MLTYYKEKVVPALQAKHQYTNVHQIPRLEKIVVTTCMGKHPDRKQAVEELWRVLDWRVVEQRYEDAVY